LRATRSSTPPTCAHAHEQEVRDDEQEVRDDEQEVRDDEQEVRDANIIKVQRVEAGRARVQKCKSIRPLSIHDDATFDNKCMCTSRGIAPADVNIMLVLQRFHFANITAVPKNFEIAVMFASRKCDAYTPNPKP